MLGRHSLLSFLPTPLSNQPIVRELADQLKPLPDDVIPSEVESLP
jgi:hypothetical protein